ncbi:hypothetical protein N7474_006188 [Penicillium riverlandense]|uniref:uncharacterized protein n=1 Tax=Penicillium riverlandense TaxID=1903569 RepID=UPI00254701DA|nr:uncharacterized protein N7474_006188 [Penicillium riverlandense]KAJ5820597.1 hypothetical protein N7474_006188 [Penicillium riverlandense]
MPSASVLSAYTFTNLGPLTTIFTPPASCQNRWNVNIAPSSLPDVWLADASCGINAEYWSCRPTGTITDLPSSTSYDNNPSLAYQAQYYSPGLYCPSGWHEVGVASRDGTKPVNWTGIFSPATPLPTTNNNFGLNLPANVLMQLLDPSETAVMCCPSSMTADEIVGCYSTLSDYKISTGCIRIFPNADISTDMSTEIWVDGVTVEGRLETLVSDLPITQTLHRSFAPSETSTLVGVTAAYPITLVHQPTDLGTANAAARLNSRSPTWNGLGGVLGVTLAAMALGAAIILPG